MATRKHYHKAPITEGLIDIKVKLPGDIDLESLDAISQKVKSEFPTKEDRNLFEGRFMAGPQVQATAQKTKLGYLFRSVDGKRVIQARLDGFTFSRLKPYESWDSLRDEAKRLWAVYRQIARPVQITRVAVRYINQIDIPLPNSDFKDYFRTFPEVSPDLPQSVRAFLMQLQIGQEDLDALLVLTQTSVPPPAPNFASIILDIDLFRQNCKLESDDEVWTLLESFRDRKNEIFEGCITDKARQLFGPVTQ